MEIVGKMRNGMRVLLTFGAVTAFVPLRVAAIAPRYGVRVEVNVRVPMRDGVKLATDLYFPEGAAGKLPAVLIRTPYNRKDRTGAARMFAGQGYVVAVQDVRGGYATGQSTVDIRVLRIQDIFYAYHGRYRDTALVDAVGGDVRMAINNAWDYVLTVGSDDARTIRG